MMIMQPVRPEASIQRLLDALEPLAKPMSVMPRKRLNWEYKGEPQFYIVKSGELSILRVSDGLLIATAYEQTLFGLAESIQPLRCHILRVETPSTLLRLNASDAKAVFTAQGLWQDATVLLSYYTSYLFYRDALLVQQRTYLIIRDHLLELIKLPLDTRLRTSILEYMQERTLLSRSSILNVIAELKNNNHIEIKRGGYLLSITTLPDRC
ncbi:helix-turn-helix domain-containing protein [Serratia sp. AKBS12]|nr:helix-turn-helix domain-containing protein [Serratia sp. AKBS12]MCS3408322.1 helix-turn-helix domain-containing protein [Serratia sp. AKBS12]